MSHRKEDEGLISWLRTLERRIKFLEAGDKAVRRNDIRIGNLVMSADAGNNQLVVRNLETGNQYFLGSERSIEWSYSGEVTVYGDNRDEAPPYRIPDDTTAVEIALSTNEAPTTDVVVHLHFPGDLAIVATLTGGTTVSLTPINIPLKSNATVYPIIVTASDANNLSVMLRFGVPQVTADAHTVA